jgi:hypothetical protein
LVGAHSWGGIRRWRRRAARECGGLWAARECGRSWNRGACRGRDRARGGGGRRFPSGRGPGR